MNHALPNAIRMPTGKKGKKKRKTPRHLGKCKKKIKKN